MKKTLLILTVLAIAASAYAVDASKGTEQGDKALLFNAAFFNAGLYNGGFGMKYYLAPGLALRPALTIGITSSTTKRDPDTLNYAPWDRTFGDEVNKSTNFGFQLAIEKVLVTKGSVNFHAVAGAGFGMGSTAYDYTYTDVNTATNTTRIRTWKTEGSNTNFGGGIGLGAEWFLNEAISLGAEYQLGIDMTSEGKDESSFTESTIVGTTTTTTITNTKNPLTSTMDFGFQTIGLTLGIRF